MPLQSKDFPGLQVDVVPPTKGGEVNVLILFHGLGDSKDPFTKFARNINLAETVAISVQGLTPIPALIVGHEGAFHWSSDIIVDEQTGDISPENDFAPALQRLSTHLLTPLTTTYKFPSRNIFFFGFGQGGAFALSLLSSPSHRSTEFGGIISIGSSAANISSSKSPTPVLLCASKASVEVKAAAVEKLSEVFRDVEVVKWERRGGDDGMPRSREEIVPVFGFLGRRLRSRSGVPDGAEEI